ncbi:MAG TPA: hypothetical protein DCG75_01140 [Bacteroidales bacterium]|nr:hypothetical protein [Bacteroidales bacterium]
MCRKLLVLLLFILLIYQSAISQSRNRRNTDSLNQNQDTLLTQKPPELSAEEISAYRLIDSVIRAEKLEEKFSKLELLINKNLTVGRFTLPLEKLINYNVHEGFRLGLGLMTNDKISKYFSVGGYIGFGFTDQAWKYGGDLILNLREESESKIHFTYAHDVIEKAGYSFLETPDLKSSEIFRKYMIEDMDLIEKYQVSFSFLSLQYLRTKIFYKQSHITATDDYTFGSSLNESTNKYIFDEIGIQFRYAYNEKFIRTLKTNYSLGTNFPVLYSNITIGTNWLDGEFEYTKYEAKVTKTFKIKTLGETRLAIVGGLIDNEVPVSKMYNGHGSYQPFSFEAENSFGTMRMGEFYSDKFLSVFFKHDFGYFFKTKIFSPKFALVNNYGIATFSNKQNHFDTIEIKSYDKGFYECGLLVNNILNTSYYGIGAAVFYRYGPYSLEKTADNFSYKLTVSIGL